MARGDEPHGFWDDEVLEEEVAHGCEKGYGAEKCSDPECPPIPAGIVTERYCYELGDKTCSFVCSAGESKCKSKTSGPKPREHESWNRT